MHTLSVPVDRWASALAKLARLWRRRLTYAALGYLVATYLRVGGLRGLFRLLCSRAVGGPNLAPPEVRVKLYARGGNMYYCEGVGHQEIPVKLHSVKGGEPVYMAVHETGTREESVLATSAIVKAGVTPRCLVAFGVQSDGHLAPLAVGFRVSDAGILLAQHTFEAAGGSPLIMFNPTDVENTQVLITEEEIASSRSLGEPRAAHAYDLAYMTIKPWKFSRTSTSKASATSFGYRTKGSITVYGHSQGVWAQSVGNLHYDLGSARAYGTMEHSASTVPGFSGSPLFDANGKIVGMHIAGRATQDTQNLAVTAKVIQQLLRTVGVAPSCAAYVRPTESREKDDIQAEFVGLAGAYEAIEKALAEDKATHRAGNIDPDRSTTQDRTRAIEDVNREEIFGDTTSLGIALGGLGRSMGVEAAQVPAPSAPARSRKVRFAEASGVALEHPPRVGVPKPFEGSPPPVDTVIVGGQRVTVVGRGIAARPPDRMRLNLPLVAQEGTADVAAEAPVIREVTSSGSDAPQTEAATQTNKRRPPQQKRASKPSPPTEAFVPSPPEVVASSFLPHAKSRPGFYPRTDAAAADRVEAAQPIGAPHHDHHHPRRHRAGKPRAKENPARRHGPPANNRVVYTEDGKAFISQAAVQGEPCPEPADTAFNHPRHKTDRRVDRPLPYREVENLHLLVQQWFANPSWDTLEPLRGVGAETLLYGPGFELMRRYMEAGRIVWADKAGEAYLDKNNEVFAAQCGTSNATHARTSPLTELSQDWYDMCERIGAPMEGRWVRPPQGPAAVMESFKAQAARQSHGDLEHLLHGPQSPDLYAWERAQSYPLARPFTSFAQELDTIIDSFDPQKSSGWSQHFHPGPKSVYQGTYRYDAYMLTLSRLALITAESHNLHLLSAARMVELGLRDPEVVTVKDEPHDGKKASSKRWRLIWVVSFIDNVVTLVASQRANKENIAAYQSGAMYEAAVGIGHDDVGITRACKAMLKVSSDGWVAQDASGWDMSLSVDSLVLDSLRRSYQEPAESPALLKDLHVWIGYLKSRHVLSVGHNLIELWVFGVQPSGTSDTSDGNTGMRLDLAYLCGAFRAMAVGDDLMYKGKLDKNKQEAAGPIVKCEEYSEEWVEFTSHRFWPASSTAQFLNLDKMKARLGFSCQGHRTVQDFTAPLPERVAGCKFAVRHDAEATWELGLLVSNLGGDFSVAARDTDEANMCA